MTKKELSLGKLEQTLENLEQLVEKLEAGDMPLNQALKEFERQYDHYAWPTGYRQMQHPLPCRARGSRPVQAPQLGRRSAQRVDRK